MTDEIYWVRYIQLANGNWRQGCSQARGQQNIEPILFCRCEDHKTVEEAATCPIAIKEKERFSSF